MSTDIYCLLLWFDERMEKYFSILKQHLVIKDHAKKSCEMELVTDEVSHVIVSFAHISLAPSRSSSSRLMSTSRHCPVRTPLKMPALFCASAKQYVGDIRPISTTSLTTSGIMLSSLGTS